MNRTAHPEKAADLLVRGTYELRRAISLHGDRQAPLPADDRAPASPPALEHLTVLARPAAR